MSYAQQRHIQKFWIQATNDEDNHRERERREREKKHRQWSETT